MTLVLSATILAFAWFGAASLAATALVWLLTRRLVGRGIPRPAGLLLFLRFLPSGAATAVAILVFLPAHIRFEPRHVDESFGVVVLGLSALGAAIVMSMAARALVVARAAGRVRRLDLPRIRTAVGDAFEVPGFAGVSLAGVLRPRILIGSAARASLTREELDVAVAHEHAHRASFDNLKRCAMACAPDVLGWSAAGRRLEAEWRALAECQADLRAVDGDARRAVHLASALIKVAKLGLRPVPASGSGVWSTFHDPPLLETRVHQLTGDPPRRPDAAGFRTLAVAACATAAAAFLVWISNAAFGIHRLTEALVAALP